MLDKLQSLYDRYQMLSAELARPGGFEDQQRFAELSRESAELAPIVGAYEDLCSTLRQIDESSQMAENESDPDLRALAREELQALQDREQELRAQLTELLIPKDPNDERNLILEIRAGTGGDEAALFAADLFRMYSRYAEERNWAISILSLNENGIGGYKELVALVKGSGAYSRLKFESGTHRVQRVPVTESGGRIHTSAATVAVMPEAEDVDVDIDPAELRIDIFRSSGAGGQHVNTTDSAVRIVHEPSGIVVSCQDERSQHKNRDKAMKILRTKLLDHARQQADSERAADRKAQVGSGDRSERIRTYNFPQGRVTDHRIGLTLHRLEQTLQGDLDEIIDELSRQHRADELNQATS